jgi:hypothetical protein
MPSRLLTTRHLLIVKSQSGSQRFERDPISSAARETSDAVADGGPVELLNHQRHKTRISIETRAMWTLNDASRSEVVTIDFSLSFGHVHCASWGSSETEAHPSNLLGGAHLSNGKAEDEKPHAGHATLVLGATCNLVHG